MRFGSPVSDEVLIAIAVLVVIIALAMFIYSLRVGLRIEVVRVYHSLKASTNTTDLVVIYLYND